MRWSPMRPLREAIDHLLVIKRSASEAQYGKPLPVINAFIEEQLERLEGVMPARGEKVDFSLLDRFPAKRSARPSIERGPCATAQAFPARPGFLAQRLAGTAKIVKRGSHARCPANRSATFCLASRPA